MDHERELTSKGPLEGHGVEGGGRRPDSEDVSPRCRHKRSDSEDVPPTSCHEHGRTSERYQ